MPKTNRQITLAARPVGVPKESDFRLVESPVPEPGEGQLLVRTDFASVDPYMRGMIARPDSYAGPVDVGDVVPGGSVGTVVGSRHPGYAEGQVVAGEVGLAGVRALGRRGLARRRPVPRPDLRPRSACSACRG